MIKSKKLSSLVAASLILAGGSFLGVQTVSADDSTRLAAVEALASQNHDSISELKETVKNISTTPEQLQQIDKNKADIATNEGNIAANTKAIDQNTTDIATNKDNIAANTKAIDQNKTDIATNKDSIAANTKAIDQNKTDIATNKDSIAANTKAIDQNKTDIATNKDNITNERAARVAAVQGESTARDEADKAEAKARTDADTKLDNRITNVKEDLQNETEKNYVSKGMYNRETSVADGAFVKEGQTVGQNLNAVDKGLNDEIAARIGADAAQDKVIQQVNQNVAKGFNDLNQNIGKITDQLNQNDLAEQQARAAGDKAEAEARDAADKNLQANINNEAKLRDEADQNLQSNINKAVNEQAGINDTLTKAVTNNSNAIVANAEAAKNLEKHLTETDGRVDKANAEIHTNAGNIAQIQKDLAASNLEDMSKTAASLKSYDTQMSTVQALAAGNKDNIDKNKTAIADEVTARDKADQQEASERKDADSQLNTKIDKGFATIQGQQDEQDNKIADHENRITANAGKIKTNTDAIKANSDKLDNHEGRIAGNENNIATNAKNISKEISARQDADTALQKNIDKEASARGDKDKEHDTAIAANKKAIGDEAAARQADISRLDNKIHDVSKEVDTVGALSMAMSGLHPLSYDEGDARFQLSAAVGTYDGTEALALGGFYHFNRDSMLSVGVATDLGADEHRMGANVGYTRRIGQGGHVSRPSEGTVSDIMKDIKNLEQKQAKLEQENEQLKQQLAALKK